MQYNLFEKFRNSKLLSAVFVFCIIHLTHRLNQISWNAECDWLYFTHGAVAGTAITGVSQWQQWLGPGVVGRALSHRIPPLPPAKNVSLCHHRKNCGTPPHHSKLMSAAATVYFVACHMYLFSQSFLV